MENEYNFTDDVIDYFVFASNYIANKNEMRSIILDYIDIEYAVDSVNSSFMAESLLELVLNVDRC